MPPRASADNRMGKLSSPFSTQHFRFIEHECGAVTDTMVRTSFLSPAACSAIVRLAEAHAQNNGWTSDPTDEYEQSTTDLEIDQVPSLRRYLLDIGFVDSVQKIYQRMFGKSIVAFNDVFLIKYSAEGQRSLVSHTDAGDLSFMLALNSPAEYTDGGTYFEELDSIVTLDEGEMLVFDAKLDHRGLPISAGVRYLLVGFCYTEDPREATEPGNVSLDFRLISGSSDLPVI